MVAASLGPIPGTAPISAAVMTARTPGVESAAVASSPRMRPCATGLRKIAACSMEDANHRSTAVIAASENRIGERHEPPYQFERFGRIGFCHLIDNGAALSFEVFDQ